MNGMPAPREPLLYPISNVYKPATAGNAELCLWPACPDMYLSATSRCRYNNINAPTWHSTKDVKDQAWGNPQPSRIWRNKEVKKSMNEPPGPLASQLTADHIRKGSWTWTPCWHTRGTVGISISEQEWRHVTRGIPLLVYYWVQRSII